MFTIDIRVYIKIKDCPSSGLSAVDFRRVNSLPEGATDELLLLFYRGSDESCCRSLEKFLDKNCDIIIYSLGFGKTKFTNYMFSNENVWPTLDKDEIKQFLHGDIVRVIEVLWNQYLAIEDAIYEKQKENGKWQQFFLNMFGR